MPRLHVTKEDFIERSNIIHGNKYSYDEFEYVNTKTKGNIRCPKHGLFDQAPHYHMRGKGCRFCVKKYKKNTSDFIKDATEVHGNLYDYSNSNYTASTKPIIISCHTHGEFTVIASHHLSYKQGCPNCNNICNTTEKFIAKAKQIHGNKYDYSESIYTQSHKKLIIKCKIHGIFTQPATAHLSGHGCTKCANINKFSFSNFRKNRILMEIPCTLYLIQILDNGDNYYKIGVTTKSIKERFNESPNITFKIIKTLNGKAFDLYCIEQKLLADIVVRLDYPKISSLRSGISECFYSDDNTLHDIINYFKN